MKHKLLAIMMLITAAAQVACNNSPSAADCNASPNCRAGVLASAGYGGYGQPTLVPLGTPMAAASQVPGPIANQPFRVASIANAAIKAQSLKVAAAIAADDNNPDSPNWKIPTPDVGKSTAQPSRTPASTSSSASIQASSVDSSGSSDIGEAAH